LWGKRGLKRGGTGGAEKKGNGAGDGEKKNLPKIEKRKTKKTLPKAQKRIKKIFYIWLDQPQNWYRNESLTDR